MRCCTGECVFCRLFLQPNTGNLSTMFNHLKFVVAGILVASGFALIGGPGETFAGEKKLYFSHSPSITAKNTVKTIGHRTSSRHSARRVIVHHRQHNRYSTIRGQYKTPTGPLVIDVQKAIKLKKFRVTTRNHGARDDINRQVIDNGIGGVRVIYYDDAKCEAGYDCVIRLGNAPSSPKVIVIGKKRAEKTPGPIIIYPPSG